VRGFKRPELNVLDDRSLIPRANLIDPPPNRFSHAVAHAQPFFWHEPAAGEKPAGTFDAGARLLLVREEQDGWCRVLDEQGLYVVTQLATLAPSR
jgi:hypothetical protein